MSDPLVGAHTRSLYARLLSYVWPYRLRMGLQLTISLLVALLELLNPWPMKVVIDTVLGSQPVPQLIDTWVPAIGGLDKPFLLIAAVTAGFGLRLLIGLLRLQGTYLNIGVRQRILLALKGDLFHQLQRQSFTFHDNRRLGEG